MRLPGTAKGGESSPSRAFSPEQLGGAELLDKPARCAADRLSSKYAGLDEYV